MYPILLKFGSFALHSYGLLAAMGFAFATVYLLRQNKKLNPQLISQDNLLNLIFGIIICAVIGARSLFVIVELKNFNSIWEIFKIWEGGLVYYGGFILSAAFFIVFARIKKINVLKLLDLFAPAAALGHFFGRLGCFAAGCCYGKPADLPWVVEFTSQDSLAPTDIHLHPTQIYEAGANFLIFLLLYFYSKKSRRNGKVFSLYLILYPAARFTIEFFRFDWRGEMFFGFSISQIISAFLFILGLILFFWKNNAKNN